MRIKDLCRPRHIRYLKSKLAGNKQKFEFIMNKFEFIMNQDKSDSSHSVKQVVNPKKESLFKFDNAC